MTHDLQIKDKQCDSRSSHDQRMILRYEERDEVQYNTTITE